MKRLSKKGLSPVVATVLLVSLVVILGVIIFLWARSVIPEVIEKNGEAIENVCSYVQFEASYEGYSLIINNIGNIPIYGLEISKKTTFGTEALASLAGSEYVIKSGELREFSPESVDLSGANEVIIVPVLLGVTSSGEKKAAACSDQYSQTIFIGE